MEQARLQSKCVRNPKTSCCLVNKLYLPLVLSLVQLPLVRLAVSWLISLALMTLIHCWQAVQAKLLVKPNRALANQSETLL